jgi:hypothetical protein
MANKPEGATSLKCTPTSQFYHTKLSFTNISMYLRGHTSLPTQDKFQLGTSVQFGRHHKAMRHARLSNTCTG